MKKFIIRKYKIASKKVCVLLVKNIFALKIFHAPLHYKIILRPLVTEALSACYLSPLCFSADSSTTWNIMYVMCVFLCASWNQIV